ncbi:uncharacterized protein LOC113348200 [Papaver somniferum]|uniref:uncharacterized protein LOC113348200 n=1 Tax=Papaver somniferum TaxID=3469 RepID=UPI000E6F4C0A|nr:uncharacterized protein LOC113348200 [Papaver somniferum]
MTVKANELDKFHKLNRSILHGKDWEEVAAIVTLHNKSSSGGGGGGGAKSVEQCKNKVDNMKKRYKVELQRMNTCGATNWIVDIAIFFYMKKLSLCVIGRFQVCSPSAGGGLSLTQLANPRWKRVVFKVSGASLVGAGPQKTDPKVLTVVTLLIAREVARACSLGVEVDIILGGRNFFCGDTWVTATGLERSTYQLGMLATVMNSVLLQYAPEALNVRTRVQTAFPVQQLTEPYNKRKAIRHLEKGRVVIFGGVGAGTGNPLFATDTAAALRASERRRVKEGIGTGAVDEHHWAVDLCGI